MDPARSGGKVVVMRLEQRRGNDRAETIDHETVGDGWNKVVFGAAEESHGDGELDCCVGLAFVEQEFARFGAARSIAERMFTARTVLMAVMMIVVVMMVVMMMMMRVAMMAWGGWRLGRKLGQVNQNVTKHRRVRCRFDMGRHLLLDRQLEFRVHELAPCC